MSRNRITRAIVAGVKVKSPVVARELYNQEQQISMLREDNARLLRIANEATTAEHRTAERNRGLVSQLVLLEARHGQLAEDLAGLEENRLFRWLRRVGVLPSPALQLPVIRKREPDQFAQQEAAAAPPEATDAAVP